MGNRFSKLHTERKSDDSFDLRELDFLGNNYGIKESAEFFGWCEGVVKLPLFGCGIKFRVKNGDSVYALRCAEYIETVTADNLKEQTALYSCLEALVGYVADMLEEHCGEFDTGDLIFDEYSMVSDLLKIIKPIALTFERFSLLSDEECPIAYSVKFCFTPVPDEIMEIAVRGDIPIYAGEFCGVSPWNDKLLKKKYNYLK